MLFDIYRVQEKPLIAIKAGFSFWALIFTLGWLLYKKLYFEALLITLIASTAMMFVAVAIPAHFFLVMIGINIALFLIIGFYGTTLWAHKLVESGYCKVARVSANNSPLAVRAYFKRVRKESSKDENA